MPVPSAAWAAIGATNGITAAGRAKLKDESFFIDYN